MYVKFKWNNETKYGIKEEFVEDAEKYHDQGLCLVSDAVTPNQYLVPISGITDIEIEMGRFNPTTGEFEGCDEYHKYVQDEFKKAAKLCESLPDGLHVGALFNTPVGDGRAWYVVTKILKKTCRIEWRGFCPDRWIDQYFEWGGSFPSKKIQQMCDRCRAIHRAFKKTI